MVSMYYTVLFALSLLLTFGYLYVWHKRFDIHITLIYVLVVVSNVGYILLGNFTYIGGSYLQLILMLAVFGLCKISLSRWIRMLLFAASTVVYLGALTIGSSPIFYKSVTFELINGFPVLH